MLPGTTEGWVLSVKMYLWLGEVFTTTCLEERTVVYFTILEAYYMYIIYILSKPKYSMVLYSQEDFAFIEFFWELRRNQPAYFWSYKGENKAFDLYHDAGLHSSLSHESITFSDIT